MSSRGSERARQRRAQANGTFDIGDIGDVGYSDEELEHRQPARRGPTERFNLPRRPKVVVPALSRDARHMSELAATVADPREDFHEVQKALMQSEPKFTTSVITPAPGQILTNLTPDEQKEYDDVRRRYNIGSFEQRFDADSRFRTAQSELPAQGTLQFNLTTTTDGRTSDIPVAPVNIVQMKVGSFLFPRSIIARYLDPVPVPGEFTQIVRRHPFNNDLVRMFIVTKETIGVEKAFFNRYHILFRVHRWTDPATVGDNEATPSSTLMVRLVPEIEGRLIFNRPQEIHGAFPLQFLDAFGPIPLNRDRFPIASGTVLIAGAPPVVTITLTIADPDSEFDFVVGERVLLVQEDGRLFRPNEPFEPWGYTITTVTLPAVGNPSVTLVVTPPAPFANSGSAVINGSDGAFLYSVDRQISVPIWFQSLSEVDTNYKTLTTS